MSIIVLAIEVIVAMLFSLGFVAIISSRSLLKMLLGVEVLFNAALLYLVLIGTLSPVISSVYAIVTVTLAAAEVIVAVSIAVLYYRLHEKVEIEKSVVGEVD